MRPMALGRRQIFSFMSFSIILVYIQKFADGVQMNNCPETYRPDRWMVYEHNTTDCSLHVPTHTALLTVYILLHGVYLMYAFRYTMLTSNRVNHTKRSLFGMLIGGSVSYLMFCVMAVFVDEAQYGVNGEGVAYAAFWTAWTAWIVFFMMVCGLVIAVIVRGAAVGATFDALKKKYEARVRICVSVMNVILVLVLSSTIYFWAICPHSVEKAMRETRCWQRGCLATMLYCIVGGGSAFVFLYKLAHVLQTVIDRSGAMKPVSAGANDRMNSKMRTTISRIKIFQCQIPPSILSSILLWGGMSMGLIPCAYWVVHIVIANSSILMASAWFLLFPIPKIRTAPTVQTLLSSAKSGTTSVQSSSSLDTESTRLQ